MVGDRNAVRADELLTAVERHLGLNGAGVDRAINELVGANLTQLQVVAVVGLGRAVLALVSEEGGMR